jgi:hypothetical protein
MSALVLRKRLNINHPPLPPKNCSSQPRAKVWRRLPGKFSLSLTEVKRAVKEQQSRSESIEVTPSFTSKINGREP